MDVNVHMLTNGITATANGSMQIKKRKLLSICSSCNASIVKVSDEFVSIAFLFTKLFHLKYDVGQLRVLQNVCSFVFLHFFFLQNILYILHSRILLMKKKMKLVVQNVRLP